jgi:transposase
MLLIGSEMRVNRAADIMGVHAQRLWNVFNYWVARARKADGQSRVEVLGIDETSTKKGHNYVTLAVDMEERRVIYVTPGKGADCVERLKGHLEEKGAAKEQIKQACIDMSPAFIAGISKSFPNAEITFDRFHTVKIINEAMDKVRKLERAEFAMLKGHKYTFLKHDKDLNEKAKEAKYGLLTLYPVIANAYRLKCSMSSGALPQRKRRVHFWPIGVTW